MKILSFGEIIWDIYEDGKCIGGAPLNFASHAALLGADSYLLSAVGTDALAEPALDCLKKFGVKCDLVKKNKKPTGQCIVSLGETKLPTYNLMSDVAYDYLDASTFKIKGFDALYFGTLIQRSPKNQKLIKKILKRCRFKHIFCDLNIRAPHFSRDSIMLCAENATILKISREELGTVTSEVFGETVTEPLEASRMLMGKFPRLKIIIITLDKDGAFALERQTERSYTLPAPETEVVSSVGAGDSFSAAFLVNYLKNSDTETAMTEAIKLSSFVVSQKDAVPIK